MGFLNEPLTSVLIKPKRMIGTIAVDVVINETTTDSLEITQQPVQQGATITDHSFKKPTTLSMQLLFGGGLSINTTGVSNLSLSDVYQKLLNLQASRLPFDVITPKRAYRSMLFSALGVTTNKQTENILSVNASFQQIFIVSIGTTTIPRRSQKSPQTTGATQNVGNKSAALSIVQGFKGLNGVAP